MPNEYKKRLKGNWRQGKGYKGDDSERQYAKNEIVEELEADCPDYLIPYKGKRKKNGKASLEYRINWYKQTLEKLRQSGRDSSEWTGYFRDGLEKAQEKLRKLLKENK